MNIAILASGNGTNAENIIRYFQQNGEADIKLVITNRAKAGVVQRAQNLGVTCIHHPKADWESGEAVIRTLEAHGIDFIVLAGFLARIPAQMIEKYDNRIVNIHPALLPKFGGKGMYGDHVHQAVIAAGETESGITIHYVNENYDEGTTIFQAKCPVLPDDTPDKLASRIHTLEYTHFPQVIGSLVKGK